MSLTLETVRLDPVVRFVSNAVGRERVSRPRRAVPAAPDGPRSRRLVLALDRVLHEVVAVIVRPLFLQGLGQRTPRHIRRDGVLRPPPQTRPAPLRRAPRGRQRVDAAREVGAAPVGIRVVVKHAREAAVDAAVRASLDAW